MRVLSLPDWREGNQYQHLLASALRPLDVETMFAAGYRRVLPLWRTCKELKPDVLHLHWPEAFLGSSGSTTYRSWRFPVDLALCCRNIPLVYTAHNLRPHDSKSNWTIDRVYKSVLRLAKVVLMHSTAAADSIVSQFPDTASKIQVVPHGDLRPTIPKSIPHNEARKMLALTESPVCLMFGAVEPYKGIDDVLEYWNAFEPPIQLIVAGRVSNKTYESTLRSLAQNNPNVSLRFGWLSDAELSLWLSAADVVLFNYRKILTSGAACLARSLGIPIVLPERLKTVDLKEPHSHVVRFEKLDEALTKALCCASRLRTDESVADEWNQHTCWQHVAGLTHDAYRKAYRGQ